jgi:hypothetical protein
MGNIKILDTNGVENIITDDESKSNAFADYFSTVFNQEPDTCFETLKQVDCQNEMQQLQITDSAVKQKLLKLKVDKSAGPDLLHPRILKELHNELHKPVTHLFNLSLKEGQLPEDWIVSDIAAIHKKGSKANVANYRPIALTSILCKTMESIIRDHIMEHFLTNNLFSKKQFGFIRGRSTVLQLLNVLDMWTASLEEGGCIDIIYTDFEKAFDKVPHKRLLSKLKTYGISDEIIAWIKGFLCNRRQRVKINGKHSKWHKVLSGIPQGSVLGPLLFIIYINDLVELCDTSANVFLFADDAKLFRHITKPSDNIALQAACDTITHWSDRWLMPLNVAKCVLLRLGKRKEGEEEFTYKISVGNVTANLAKVTSTKDLGVIVDDKLNFKEHIISKINKAFSMLGIIKRNFRHMHHETFIKIYKTMVRSHLDYAATVWAPHAKGMIDEIERVQRRATKMVRHCYNMNYETRLKFLKLPTLSYRRLRGDMIEVYKILTNKVNTNELLQLGLSKCTNTRGNALKLDTIRTKYDIRKHFFSVRIVSVWNSLPDCVINALTTNAFKNALDKHWSSEKILYDYRAALSGTGVRGMDI